MFELVFLGTSASAPSIHRGLSATAVLAGDMRFLVDCGEGTQRQILRSGIGFKRLNNVLVTHSHLDHILGLGGLISTFVRWENIEEMTLWGGDAALDRIETLIHGVVLRDEVPPIPLHFNRLDAGPFIRHKDFNISAFPVSHRGPGCFGFIFEEKTRRPFLSEKAEALGIPFGPERSQLVRGEAVTLPNGTIIQPDEVLGDAQAGTKVVFTGDLGRTDNIRDYVQNADALVIESTFLDDERDMANRFGHITARQAAELAAEANVGNLLITHVSRRYREHDIIQEARSVFPDAIVVRDLDHYIIKQGEPVSKKQR